MSDKLAPGINETNRLYWEGTAVGELRLRSCNSCKAKFRFNHGWCPECGSDDLGHVVSTGKGTVTNFSVIHVPPYEAYAAEVPYALALIDLEEGVRMMANVVDCDPASVSVGMKVSVTYEDRGGVKLPQFKPV